MHPDRIKNYICRHVAIPENRNRNKTERNGLPEKGEPGVRNLGYTLLPLLTQQTQLVARPSDSQSPNYIFILQTLLSPRKKRITLDSAFISEVSRAAVYLRRV